jgi:hypothetical protein
VADEFTLSDAPIRVITTTGPIRQPLDSALEVGGYDEADVLLHVLCLAGTSPNVTVKLLTAMQKDSEEGWCVAVTFDSVTSGNSCEKKNVPGLLKYLRWEIELTGSASPEVWLTIAGMLRNFS